MVFKKGNDIWESDNKDLKLEKLIEDFIEMLKNVSISNRESFTLKKLREILEEDKLLEEIYE